MFLNDNKMLKKSFCLFVLFLFMICQVISDDTSNNKYEGTNNNEYYREWVAKVRDPLEADLIALETGFVNKGPVSFVYYSKLL
jgi:hypothetical protein